MDREKNIPSTQSYQRLLHLKSCGIYSWCTPYSPHHFQRKQPNVVHHRGEAVPVACKRMHVFHYARLLQARSTWQMTLCVVCMRIPSALQSRARMQKNSAKIILSFFSGSTCRSLESICRKEFTLRDQPGTSSNNNLVEQKRRKPPIALTSGILPTHRRYLNSLL